MPFTKTALPYFLPCYFFAGLDMRCRTRRHCRRNAYRAAKPGAGRGALFRVSVTTRSFSVHLGAGSSLLATLARIPNCGTFFGRGQNTPVGGFTTAACEELLHYGKTLHTHKRTLPCFHVERAYALLLTAFSPDALLLRLQRQLAPPTCWRGISPPPGQGLHKAPLLSEQNQTLWLPGRVPYFNSLLPPSGRQRMAAKEGRTSSP